MNKDLSAARDGNAEPDAGRKGGGVGGVSGSGGLGGVSGVGGVSGDAPAARYGSAGRQPAAPKPAVRSIVFVCHGPSCSERGSPALCKQLRERLNESSARRAVRVCETTCLDHCATGPNALLSHEGAIEACLAPERLDDVITLLTGGGAPRSTGSP